MLGRIGLSGAVLAVVGMAGVAGVAGVTGTAQGDWSGQFHLSNGGGGWGPGGLSVSGSYRGSRWSADYNVGSGWFTGAGNSGSSNYPASGGGFTYTGSGSRYYRGYYDDWWRYRYGYYRPYGWASGPIDSRQGPIDWSLLPGVNPQTPTAAPAAAPPPEPTKLELAQRAVAAKQFDQARSLFDEHLKAQPDDVEASRQFAMCLIEAKELDSGLSMLRDLYTNDPTLAERPYAGDAVGHDAGRLREMVAKVTPHAHKVKSPSAWLGVVVLMQAEGRKAAALKILDRAKDAGLERAVVERFAATLAPPPKPVKAAPVKKPVAKPTPGSSTPAPTTPPGPPAPGPAAPEMAQPAAEQPATDSAK